MVAVPDRTRLCSSLCHPEEPCWLTSDGACMIDPGEWRLERVGIILESEPQTPVAVAQARAEAMWEAWCASFGR